MLLRSVHAAGTRRSLRPKKEKIVEKIVEVGMPAEQVESLMQVKLSQARIELQTHFKAEVANVLQKQQGLCLEKGEGGTEG